MNADIMSLPAQADIQERQRLRLRVSGAVQGVGFRPFVFRLAARFGLKGWVLNNAQGVLVEAEGPAEKLEDFMQALRDEKPAAAAIHSMEQSYAEPVGFAHFRIVPSQENAQEPRSAWVMPDLATCPECLREMFDPSDRRFLYPFINCTHCGPRFTIVEDLPYDRERTSMKAFAMCDACRAEYENPADRRFHAEPIACPRCGPHVELWDGHGAVLASHHEALLQAAQKIREGGIVAVKGIGGFHLYCDARSEQAVQALRNRKHREEKPLAVMFPDLESVERCARVSRLESGLLRGPEAPIVLLRCRPAARGLAHGVAPGNPYVGVLLPYAPLHHLLLLELGFPIVATSGNFSEEPICLDGKEALGRLKGVADFFLTHDRPIVRHADDSIVRVMADRPLVLRRARGFAPMPVALSGDHPAMLACGGHLKNTVCLLSGHAAYLSQHVGDLDNKESRHAFQTAMKDLPRLYGSTPRVLAADMHPAYASTQAAHASGLPVIAVQHHHAHVAACMAENDVRGPVLGVAWDGTGLGPDGTVWGGEFLRVDESGYERLAHLRTFPLPGGERAAREPRRVALGMLHEIFGAQEAARPEFLRLWGFSATEITVLLGMLRASVNAPRTSSAGRLFDAVASLLGLRQINRFEGQAAMELEWACPEKPMGEAYPFTLGVQGLLDWEPMLREILREKRAGVAPGSIAEKFHRTLVAMIVAVAHRVGEKRVVLSGGCFQNKILCEWTVARLRHEGFTAIWHQRVPPNDGGLALGQAVAAAAGRSACA